MLIQNLPQEAIQAFGDVINILMTLPSEIINVAEAAVIDVMKIVNDIEEEQITSDLAALPSEIVAGITQGLGDITNGLTDA
ncbi:hypothetical protein N7G274_004136 [Stereocaulon virgatum]|uniref:Uncharacterized protein n=1 Tax=Stereocaulon virgatum TaxID=373712 RepID=A0ABR4AC75_9LECA